MGLDFIELSKGGIKKGWDKAKQRLSLDELEFNVPIEKIRTIQVSPLDPSCAAEVGKRFAIKEENGAILVISKGNIVGICQNAPSSIVEGITDLGGYGFGRLDRVKELSKLWDVAVILEPAVKDVEN